MVSPVVKQTLKDYYVLIYAPEHPRSVGPGYVPEQILVAEKTLNRSLTPDEEVRHKNGKVKDNRASNLEIVSSNTGYKSQSVSSIGNDIGLNRSSRISMVCQFHQPCWKGVRLPAIKRTKRYQPYICSYVTLGDVYECPIFWTFMKKKLEEEEGVDGIGNE